MAGLSKSKWGKAVTKLSAVGALRTSTLRPEDFSTGALLDAQEKKNEE